jgi:hypothetical protein
MLPYTSSSTRAGYDNFTNTGYTQWNEANWNDTSQQAPQLASFGDAEYFTHTSNPILEQWHPDQGEQYVIPHQSQTYLADIRYSPISTSWPNPSPYLHPARDSFANAITLQTAPDVHGSEGMTRYPPPLPADPDSAPSSELENNSNVMIGSICATSPPEVYVFKCHGAKCASLTFGRWYDFRRHYNGAHAAAPTVYWCDFEGCPRSRGVGDRPFTRKDKVKDHFESIHKEEVEAGE